jgi:hypothetical protein
MKKILRLKIKSDGGSLYDSVQINDPVIFLSSYHPDKPEINGVTYQTIKSQDLQDKVLYRFPKLDLPRQKMDLLKDKFDVKLTRNIDKADYLIVSHKYQKSMSDYSWYSLYEVKNVITEMASHKQHFTTECFDSIINALNTVKDDDYVELKFQHYYKSSLPNLTNDGSFNELISNYYYIKPEFEEQFTNISTYNNLILDTLVTDFTYEDLHVIDKKEYISTRSMIKSDDKENRSLALELLANCNLTKSYDYVSMLFYFYYDYLKDTRNWNNVNVKTMRKSLEAFVPRNNASYGGYYEQYLKTLISKDKFTEFAFTEVARYAFHNVLKKSMALSDDSVFKINLDAIKINPKYIDNLKKNNDFFMSEIEEELIKL